MDIGDALADGLAEHAKKRSLRRIDGHDVQPLLPKRSGHLRSDEPHPDD